MNKYKIVLGKRGEDHTNPYNVITMCNNPFDTQNGVAFFEIERDKWDVLDVRMQTGIHDMEGDMIHDKDVLISTQYPDMEFKVRWEPGGFVINTPVKRWENDKYPWTALADEQTFSWVTTTCTIKND